MKTSIISFLIILCSVNVLQAKKYYDAEIFFKDGTSKMGMAEFIEEGMARYIKFKTNKDAKAEKVESTDLNRIVYSIDGNTIVFEQVKVYRGLKQNKIAEPRWLHVLERGITTLYTTQTTIYSGNNRMNGANFTDYYCIRDGEPAAKLISVVSTFNNNATFKAYAPDYFKDYPELSAKIEAKEYKYDDIVTVVKEYNIWAAKNK